MDAHVIRPGRAYSNGVFGRNWQVREVVATGDCPERPEPCLTYRVAAGPQRRQRHTCTLGEFAAWARYEVVRNESSWERAALGE